MVIGGIDITKWAEIFVLILARTTTLFLTAPIFRINNVPRNFKIAFSVIIAFMIMPMIGEGASISYSTMFGFVILTIGEVAVGLLMGIITYTVFSGLYVAGVIIDMQVGFGMVNVMDPQSNIQIPVMANFLNIVTTIFFLAVNGHHMIISAIFYSYTVLPIGIASMSQVLYDDVVRIFANMFVIGFKVAAPILAAILITDFALGILAKISPQMNVFVLGMSIKILIGLLVLIAIIPLFLTVMENLVSMSYYDLEKVLKGMGTS